MALENLTGADKGINDLVAANPDGLDPKSEGDNHVRGIKNVLRNVFGAMVSAATSLPAVGALLTWDGAKYIPQAPAVQTPIGAMLDYGGTVAPAGYLACDGSTVSRTTFAALFTAIGTTWNTGGEAGTDFRLPDFRRRVAVGSGGTASGILAATVGSRGGAETHTLTTAELAAHVHGGVVNNTVTAFYAAGGGTAFLTAGVTASEGGGGAHNNVQPSAVVLKIIRAS